MTNDEPGWTPPQQPPENPYGDSAGQPPQPPPAYPQQPPAGQPAAPQQPYGQPAYGQPAYGQPGYGQPGYPGGSAYGLSTRDPNARPGTVTAAAVITWILTALTGIVILGLTVALLVAKPDVLDAMRDELNKSDSSITVSDLESIYSAIVVVFFVFLAWCLIAFLLAVFTYRRSNVARILLVISSSVTALFSLIGIASGVSAITLIGSAAVIVLLFVGGAGDWFAKRGIQVSPTQQPW